MADPSPNPDARWSALLAGGRLARFAVVCLGVWLNAADTLVTTTIMPSVARDFGHYALFAWPTAAYVLGAILAGASAGQLSMRAGLRRAMVVAGLAYAVGCVGGALAPGMEAFVTGRLVQGVGAGWLIGLCYIAINVMFPEPLWPRVFAAVAGVWGIATVLGPLVGGLFAEAGAWRGVFWAFGGQAVLFCLAAPMLLPREARATAPKVPWLQLIVLAGSVAALAAASLAARAGLAFALTAASLVLLGLMLAVDRRAKTRLAPRDASDLATAAGAGYATVFLLETATGAFNIYGAALLQALHHLSPLRSGYAVGAIAMGWTLAAFAVSRASARRTQDRLIRLGSVLILLGEAALVWAVPRGPWTAGLTALVLGSGFGFAWAFVNARVIHSLPPGEREAGSTALPTVQMAGAAMGSAAAGALGSALGLRGGIDAGHALPAIPWLFGLFAPIALLGVWTALRLVQAPESVKAE